MTRHHCRTIRVRWKRFEFAPIAAVSLIVTTVRSTWSTALTTCACTYLLAELHTGVHVPVSCVFASTTYNKAVVNLHTGKVRVRNCAAGKIPTFPASGSGLWLRYRGPPSKASQAAAIIPSPPCIARGANTPTSAWHGCRV